jgi:hypothetical protein
MTFSPLVAEKVERHYWELANKNYSHFVNPGFGVDKNGLPKGGAEATYVEAHKRAIDTAYAAGTRGGSIDDAMITEAMAEHFLTDAFAAGHVSTRRGSIEEFWDKKYPRFATRFVNNMVSDISEYLEKTATGVLAIAEIDDFKPKVRAQMDLVMDKQGKLTLGKLIGVIAHDYDNDHGLFFVNDVGFRWFGYGDSGLDHPLPDEIAKKNPGMPAHKDVALAAVNAGIDDVLRAYALGKSSKGLAGEELYSVVRQQSAPPAKPGPRFAAEQYMPRVDPDKDQGELVTEEDSIENLFETRIRRGKESYRELIVAGLNGGATGATLEEVMAGLPEVESVAYGAGHTRPRDAFKLGVLDPLRRDPIAYLKNSI